MKYHITNHSWFTLLFVCVCLLAVDVLYAANPEVAADAKKEMVSEAIKPETMKAEIGFCYLGALSLVRIADSPDENQGHANLSECILLEDGKPLGPPHTVHAEIREIGKGRYSHWTRGGILFSTSDNSDPRTNGRKYTLVSPRKEMISEEIKTETISVETGFCYLGGLTLARTADSPDENQGQANLSECILLEDGKPLGPPHTVHAEIREIGKGRYSHWTKNFVLFSTSDNSDPRTNGRKYTLASPKK